MYQTVCSDQGPGYAAILRHAFARGLRFSLVWRDQLAFDENASKIADLLAPSVLGETHTDRWPGTVLSGSKARVRVYRMDLGSLHCLSAVKSLFQWRAPSYPEDLAIYQSQGECCVASVSHEQLAWIDFSSLGLGDPQELATLFQCSGMARGLKLMSVAELIRGCSQDD